MGEEEEGECQECRAADRSFLLKERRSLRASHMSAHLVTWRERCTVGECY